MSMIEPSAMHASPATDDSAPPPISFSWHWDLRTLSLLVIAALATFYTLYFTRALLFPILLAMILNLLLSPVVRGLHRLWIPHWIGAALVVAALLAVVVWGALRFVQPAMEWAQTAPETLRQVEIKLRAIRKPIDDFNEASQQVEEMTQSDGDDESVKVEMMQPSMTNWAFNMTGSVAAGLFLSTVLLYFLLAPGDRFVEKLLEVLPTERDKRSMADLVRQIEQGIGGYLLTITTINVCLGIAIATAMWLLDVPNPMLWGLMATSLNFVPYAGAMVGAGVISIVGLVTFGTIGEALAPPFFYLVLTTMEGSFITPAILGRSMKMNPVAILLSLAFWGWMWGIGGALLAVPILAMIKITCDRVAVLNPAGKFLEA